MRPFLFLFGVVLIAAGMLAAFATEFDNRFWWVLAVAIAAAGILGIVSAVRGSDN